MESFFQLLNFSQVFTPAFYSALLAIVLIDLALAGDNALVIGLAARQLPPHLQKKVLLWGSIAAVAVRAAFTLVIVWLLKIPGFMAVGGVILLWIAYKLVQPQEEKSTAHGVAADVGLRQAVLTIVVADTAMGIENVIAVGGAAHGSVLLVILGLLISVPIIMFGSQMVLKLVERFPQIILLGGAILAWTAIKMLLGEPYFKTWLTANAWIKLPLYIAGIAAVVVPPLWQKQKESERNQWLMLAFVIAWLMVFDVIEAKVGMHPMFEPGWHIGEEVLDAVMWVGWIPFVVFWQKVKGRTDSTK